MSYPILINYSLVVSKVYRPLIGLRLLSKYYRRVLTFSCMVEKLVVTCSKGKVRWCGGLSFWESPMLSNQLLSFSEPGTLDSGAKSFQVFTEVNIHRIVEKSPRSNEPLHKFQECHTVIFCKWEKSISVRVFQGTGTLVAKPKFTICWSVSEYCN